MIKNISLIFLCAVSIFIIVGCNDSPTDLGSEFLSQDGVEVLKLDSSIDSIPQKSYSLKKVFALGSSSQLLLGKAENITSNILLKFIFAIPDSINKELKLRNLTVIDSYIEMVKNYSFGNSNGTFDYNVYKVNEQWSSSTFTSDSLEFFDYDSTIDLSFNRINTLDSLYSFHLDTTLASSWLQNYADSSVASNHGILLSPTDETQKVLGFTAFNINGVNDPRLRIVVRKSGWAENDTLIGYIASDLSVVTGEKPDFGFENLVLQSSLAVESKLSFDLSAIPDTIDISYAKLTLTIDTLLTKTGSNFNNKLRVYLLADSSKDSININIAHTLDRKDATFSGEITSIVRAWIDNNLRNEGMLIKTLSEFNGLELFVLKGSNAANAGLRPKLEIYYSRGVR